MPRFCNNRGNSVIYASVHRLPEVVSVNMPQFRITEAVSLRRVKKPQFLHCAATSSLISLRASPSPASLHLRRRCCRPPPSLLWGPSPQLPFRSLQPRRPTKIPFAQTRLRWPRTWRRDRRCRGRGRGPAWTPLWLSLKWWTLRNLS